MMLESLTIPLTFHFLGNVKNTLIVDLEKLDMPVAKVPDISMNMSSQHFVNTLTSIHAQSTTVQVCAPVLTLIVDEVYMHAEWEVINWNRQNVKCVNMKTEKSSLYIENVEATKGNRYPTTLWVHCLGFYIFTTCRGSLECYCCTHQCMTRSFKTNP